jgi:hypothetical protein
LVLLLLLLLWFQNPRMMMMMMMLMMTVMILLLCGGCRCGCRCGCLVICETQQRHKFARVSIVAACYTRRCLHCGFLKRAPSGEPMLTLSLGHCAATAAVAVAAAAAAANVGELPRLLLQEHSINLE